MNFSRADLDRIAAIMAEAAETEIMPRFRAHDNNVREKTGALDLVTDADEQARQKYPDGFTTHKPYLRTVKQPV